MRTERLETLAIPSAYMDLEKGARFGYLNVTTNAKDFLEGSKGPKIVEVGAIFICTHGETDVILDGKRYHIKSGDLCLVFPYTIFQPICETEELDGHIYAINMKFLEQLNTSSVTIPDYMYIKNNPCIALKPVQQEELLSLCDLIKRKSFERSNPFSTQITEHLMSVFFYELSSIYSSGKPLMQKWQSRGDQVFYQFLFSLTHNYKDHRDVEFYAGEACLTPRHFSTMIKQKSGKTAGQWITERIVLQAKNLLSTTQLTVQQISEELRFPNHSFFGTYFRKHVGMTPMQYRQENKL